jgi:hypothetical protein
VLADDGENVFNVITRINDHGLVRGLVSDDGAVALQRAYGQDLVNHPSFSLRPLDSTTL